MVTAQSRVGLTPRPATETLDTLQQFQLRHDQIYHPEIHGMDRWDQAMHYLAHLAKISGRIADLADKLDHDAERHLAGPIVAELRERRFPDLLLFSLKLCTLFGLLPSEAFFARMKAVETRRMGNWHHYTPLPANEDIAGLQWYQEQHDRLFHKEVVRWKRRRRLKHICLHIAKATGILADWCDKWKHRETEAADALLDDLKARRLPDLIIYCLIFAYMFKLDLAHSYYARIERVEIEGLK